jgi:Tol biopolymer transport system component
MTAPDRLESELPRLLEHLYLGPRPPYADDALRMATSSPRRTGLSLDGHWLQTIAPVQPFAASRLPWRTILVAGLITLALLGGALYVGGQQRALPMPVAPDEALAPAVGPAGNGLIAYTDAGDILVGDPTTGATTAIVTGPGEAVGPIFSPDGTHIAFLRDDVARDTGPEIVVVRADGSDERIVMPGGFSIRGVGFAWTPDSTGLVVNHDSEPATTPFFDGELSLLDASGVAAPRLLTPPLPKWPGAPWFSPRAGVAPMFRPPDGDLILSGDYDTLNVFDADLATFTKPADEALKEFEPYWVADPAWSPDGSMIAFGLDRSTGTGTSGQIGSFVMNADGSDLRRLGSDLAGSGAWSPDGTKIALERWSTDPDRPGAVIVIIDLASGAEHELATTAAETKVEGVVPSDPNFHSVTSPTGRKWDYEGWSWSPDGHSIVVLERYGTRPLVIDVETGQATELPWESDSAPSWQRDPLD